MDRSNTAEGAYKTVHGELSLLLLSLAVLLGVLHGHLDEVRVLRLVGGGKEEGRVSRGILQTKHRQI